MAADLTASPPADVPDALRDGIEKLDGPLRNHLMAKAVPYLIQHRLGMDKYTTIEDVADCWDAAQAARQHGPATMQFRDGDHGFTAESSAYAAMKLFQAVRAAKDLLQSQPSVVARSALSPMRSAPLSEVLCERPQLEKGFMAKWGVPKPQYRDQGSDALIPSTSSVPFRKKGNAQPKQGVRS